MSGEGARSAGAGAVGRDAPARAIDIVKIGNGAWGRCRDVAAVEEPLQVVINGDPFTVIMRTPGADVELTAGFLIAEGIVVRPSELVSLGPGHYDGCRACAVMPVALDARARARVARVRRTTTTTAACGMCGRVQVDVGFTPPEPVGSSSRIHSGVLADLPERLRRAQDVFERTGGLHAAGLFQCDGTLISIAEDVGRHNAVDKVLGRCWLAANWPLDECVLCVSGRTSYEIVQKAVTAGVRIVAAVSAPSTLAIDLAERAGLTLTGFVRHGAMNVYTHPDRIDDL